MRRRSPVRSSWSGRSRAGIIASVLTVGALGVPNAVAAPLTSIASAATAANATARLDTNVGGWAENTLPLPGGDVLISNLTGNAVQRINGSTGAVTTVASVPSPGGLGLRGDTLYVVTGNSSLSALTRAGGVVSINLTTGARTTHVSGLGEANGLALLPDGDVVYDVTVGPGTGVHRLRPSTGQSRVLTTGIVAPNGLAVGPDGQVYVGSTVTGTIRRLDPATGAHTQVASGSVGLDDFAFLADGRIVAATVLGFIDLISPTTGANRPLASGFVGATSAKPTADGRIVISTTFGAVTTIPAP